MTSTRLKPAELDAGARRRGETAPTRRATVPALEEILYSALEDFRVDILVGAGPGARTHSLPMPRFTAIGATTRQGLVSAPLRGRFGLVLRAETHELPGQGRP